MFNPEISKLFTKERTQNKLPVGPGSNPSSSEGSDLKSSYPHKRSGAIWDLVAQDFDSCIQRSIDFF